MSFKVNIFVKDIVKGIVVKDAMDAADVPLLDVGDMRIRQPEQTLGKMPHYRVPVQKFLIIEPLRQELFLGRGAYQRALVGKNKLLFTQKRTRTGEYSGFTHKREIHKYHARVYIVGTDQIFAVVIPRGGVLEAVDVNVVQKSYVAVEHYVRVKVQKLVRKLRKSVGKQAYQGIRRAIGALVWAGGKFLAVKSCDVDKLKGRGGVIFFCDAVKKFNLSVGHRHIVGAEVADVHSKDIEFYRAVLGAAAEHGQHTGQHSVEHTRVAGEHNVDWGSIYFEGLFFHCVFLRLGGC